jgi:hypothetical protein
MPNGTEVYVLNYPYFAQNPVECCIYCSQFYHDVVASAFLSDAAECECLLDTKGDYPRKSDFCPNGKVPYAAKKKAGIVLYGACRAALGA